MADEDVYVCRAGKRLTHKMSGTVPFATGPDLSCGKDVSITDSRLPGGTAAGKVVRYVLRASGDGSRLCEITIGCTIENGGSQIAAAGMPAYAADVCMNPG